jgi:hypothetical protein
MSSASRLNAESRKPETATYLAQNDHTLAFPCDRTALLLVDPVPWDSPPARSDQREKLGPPKSSVAKLYRLRAPSIDEKPIR